MIAAVKKSLSLVFILYGALIVVLYIQQRNHIYFPTKAPPDAAFSQSRGFFANPVQVKTQDELDLAGWFFAPSEIESKIILYFHGNAGSIEHRQDKILPYLSAGHGVLLAEYRGYGGNSGAPTEAGLYNDARAYYQWLLDAGYKAENIVVYGESLGSGVATQMAVEYGPAALILETPYASLADAARHQFFFIPFLKQLMHDDFASDEKIHKYHGPKLFLIAGKDEVLGSDTGLKLYEAAQEPKTLKVFEAASHNTVYDYKAPDMVLNFVEDL